MLFHVMQIFHIDQTNQVAGNDFTRNINWTFYIDTQSYAKK